MQVINIVLIIGIFILGGCSKSFRPKNSTCNRVSHDLATIKLSGDTKYSRSELIRLESILDDCNAANALSQADYKKYKELLDDLNELNSEADNILNTTIHDIRIK